jgi:hypothetical protein
MTQNHEVSTEDIYESAFMLTKGAAIINVSVLQENNKPICRFTFSGESLLQAQNDYYNAKAVVNLWEFRRCFNRINSLIGTARKEYREQKASLQGGSQ